MSQEQAPERIDIRQPAYLEALFHGARQELNKRRGALFAAPSKAGALAVGSVFTPFGEVRAAQYVLAYNNGQLLPEASDIRMYTSAEAQEAEDGFSLLHDGDLSDEAVKSVIGLADATARAGLYVHRTVLDMEAPLPEQMVPLASAYSELTQVA